MEQIGMTHSEENYLKGIYHLSQGGKKSISTNALAGQMDTKPSSVTDMLRRLSEKDLVHYKKYQGVRLTELGTRLALKVIRKHRLWEVFLVEKLDFTWDEVHEIAEQLEHIESEKLIDRLDALLDYPEFDPHGDPIPDKSGQFKTREKKLLSQMPVPSRGTCVGVKDSSSPFLKFLDKHRIELGKSIEVLDREPYDHSMQIRIDGERMRISQQIASNLYVKPNTI
jgi:DtxR family Mn-dependent transcriptional regulator